jgi:hypothetical protein
LIVALSNFLESTTANLVAGLVLLALTAILVSLGIELRASRLAKREEELGAEKTEAEQKRAVLTQVKKELSWNLGQVNLLRNKRTKTVPAVVFTVHGWDLLRQGTVLTRLQPDTITALVGTYRMLRIVGEVHRLAAEHEYGPTRTIVEHVAKTQSFWPQMEPAYRVRHEWYFRQLMRYIHLMDTESMLRIAIWETRSERKRAYKEWQQAAAELEALEEQGHLSRVVDLLVGTKRRGAATG